jgi:hypothetical protein
MGDDIRVALIIKTASGDRQFQFNPRVLDVSSVGRHQHTHLHFEMPPRWL